MLLLSVTARSCVTAIFIFPQLTDVLCQNNVCEHSVETHVFTVVRTAGRCILRTYHRLCLFFRWEFSCLLHLPSMGFRVKILIRALFEIFYHEIFA